jgi:competence protein ComEC
MKQLRHLLLLALALLPAISFSQANRNMRAHIINVGQGNAALLEFPCGVILIDAGGESNAEFNGRQALSDYLKEFFSKRGDLNKTIDLFLITHPHKDHTLGVRDVLETYTVKNVVTNGQEYGSGSAQQKLLHKYVDDSEASEAVADVGFFESVTSKINSSGKTSQVIDPINCADVNPTIKVLWGRVPSAPASWNTEAFHNNNNHSVVTRIDFGESSILFTGDMEDVAITDLVKKYKSTNLLDVDVYVVGHHASKNGSTLDLVKAMTPEMAIISCGDPERELAWTAWT